MTSETPLVRNRAGFSSPPVLGEVAATSADGVVLSTLQKPAQSKGVL